MSLRFAFSCISRILAALALPGLAACATGPQLRDYHVLGQAVELNEVPFYPLDGYQGAPAALAMTLAASGVQVAPAELVPLVYDARTNDSPQASMRVAASRYGRVPYVLRSKQLDLDLVRLVQSGHPVLLLLRTGLVLKQWNYAVVVGVDPAASTFTLRTGTERQLRLSYGELVAAWHDSSYWAMLTIPPGEIPDTASAQDWLTGAAALEQSGKTEEAVQAYVAVTRRWPNEAQAWAGLGRAYHVMHNLRGATIAFNNEVMLQPHDAAAHNGLAQVLLERQCADQAEDEINRALALETDPDRRTVYLHTRKEVAKYSGPSVVCQLE